jgi:diacylglycerol kinase (ATP)
MRIEIITNPRSGRGQGPARAAAIAAELVRRGHRPRIHAGRDRQDAVEWARRAARSAERLVVVGGDGSLSAVLEGLPDEPPPVALCPFGTGNVLGTDLGLTGDPLQTVELLERGRVQPLDLGRVGERRCFMVLGFGFDGEIMRRLEERRSGTMNKLEYVPLVLGTLRGWRPVPQQVVADGRELGEYEFGIIANVRRYGTSALRLGTGSYDDGVWEMFLLRRASLVGGLRAALGAFLHGAHRSRILEHHQVREVQVRGDRPTPVQVDGDHHGPTPLEFRVTGERLPLLVPEA